MNLLKWLAVIFGEGAQLAPIFIHNPKSQQIEGAVLTTTDNLLGAIATIQAQSTASKAPVTT